jgi:hypothetical protein
MSHSYNLGPLVFEVVKVDSRHRGRGTTSRYLLLRCLTDETLSGRLDLPGWIERDFKAGTKVRIRLQDRYPSGAVASSDDRGSFSWLLTANEMEIDGHTLPLKKWKVQELLRKIGC